MDWLEHPAYLRARKALTDRLAGSIFQFAHLRPVVFLCGKQQSRSRDALFDYLRQYHPNVFIFYAETVWSHVANLAKTNALEMENELAHLSDIIIILVESPGTFTELGAFSLHENLRPKLLPILDRRFRDTDSFINTGPVAWIDESSRFAPAIYTNLRAILTAAADVDKRLQEIPSAGRLPRDLEQLHPSDNPKRLLFFLCDLLAIIGPATEEHCTYYCHKLFGEDLRWSITNLIGLAVSLRLIIRFASAHNPNTTYYYRPLSDGQINAFQKQGFIDLAEERAKILSAYLRIPAATEALQELANHNRNA